ncbi:MAG: endo-1,4-beta-xylanase [Bacteroidota bacterium]
MPRRVLPRFCSSPFGAFGPALTAALLLVGGAGAAAQGSPLNTNGGFESAALGPVTDLAGGVDGWTLSASGSVSPAPLFTVVEDGAEGSGRALQVTVDGVGPNTFDIQAVATGVPVTPGGTYLLTVQARSEGPGGLVTITAGNSSFQEYGRLGGQVLPDDWKRFAFEFTVADQETVARAPIHFSFQSNVGKSIVIDDLQIVAVDGPGPSGPPLADGLPTFVGSAFSASQTRGFEAYWNQVTAENAGKWGVVEPTRDQMDWTELDAAYALAQDNGLPYRHHVLVWGNQQPAWMAALPPDEQLAEIREWFEAVAARYPDIDFLEVVNEPLHDPPDDPEDGGYIEALGGSGQTGWDWVITAFQLAREVFPADVELMISDFNILSSTATAIEYRQIVTLLQDRDLIDRIGVQGHAFSTWEGAPITQSLDLLAETGLPIHVTEVDFDGNRMPETPVSTADSDQTQLEAIQRVFPALWEHPAVDGITLWGWRPGLWRTPQEAWLVRAGGEERPAMVWLREYLDGQRATPTETEAEREAAWVRNAPNPVTHMTNLSFAVTQPSDVTLSVYDATGRRVAVLVDGVRGPGEYRVPFDAAGLAGGTYLYRLTSGTAVATGTMVIIR